jgi:hypothetical protein
VSSMIILAFRVGTLKSKGGGGARANVTQGWAGVGDGVSGVSGCGADPLCPSLARRRRPRP